MGMKTILKKYIKKKMKFENNKKVHLVFPEKTVFIHI